MVNQQYSAIRARLVEIFETILKRPIGPDEIVRRLDEKRWDSLLHVELVFVVEDAFNIAFAPEDLDKLVSLEAFVEVVASLVENTA